MCYPPTPRKTYVLKLLKAHPHLIAQGLVITEHDLDRAPIREAFVFG
jgi:hypothetical protein